MELEILRECFSHFYWPATNNKENILRKSNFIESIIQIIFGIKLSADVKLFQTRSLQLNNKSSIICHLYKYKYLQLYILGKIIMKYSVIIILLAIIIFLKETTQDSYPQTYNLIISKCDYQRCNMVFRCFWNKWFPSTQMFSQIRKRKLHPPPCWRDKERIGRRMPI